MVAKSIACKNHRHLFSYGGSAIPAQETTFTTGKVTIHTVPNLLWQRCLPCKDLGMFLLSWTISPKCSGAESTWKLKAQEILIYSFAMFLLVKHNSNTCNDVTRKAMFGKEESIMAGVLQSLAFRARSCMVLQVGLML